MGRFAHRITMPFLASIGLLAGSAAFAQRFNPDDETHYLTLPKTTSTLQPDSTYGVIFTHLHGPEKPEPALQLLMSLHHMLDVEEVFNTPSKEIGYHGLGNALDSIGRNDMATHFRDLAQSHTNRHNMMICFHGSAYIDSTYYKDKAFVAGQYLRNDMEKISQRALSDVQIVAPINQHATPARYDILWIPCQGGSAARIMGAFPPNSTILVESDAFHDTHDYQHPFIAAFQKQKPWTPVTADHFLEARLFFQNSMGSDSSKNWNENLLAFYTTDDPTPRPPVVIDNDTISFVRRRAHVLDFNHMAPRVTTEFTKEQLEKSADTFRDIVEAAAIMRANTIADKRDMNPNYIAPKSGYFDFSLPEKTIGKLSRIHSSDDFQKKLTDPERKFARIIMMDLYRDNKELLETTEEYVQRVNIIPLAPMEPK